MSSMGEILLIPGYGRSPEIVITPPSSVIGESGVASGLFNASLNNGSGPVDITFTTSGAGTFAPPTATLTPASPNVTVTFTPSAAGSNQISVTVTNGSARPPRSPPTYTAFTAATGVWPLRTEMAASVGVIQPAQTYAGATSFTDHEGYIRPTLSGECRFNRARRIYNLLTTTSETFSSATYTKTSTTITSTILDPLGGTTAFTLTATGSNGVLTRSITTITGNTYAGSLWIKRRTGTGAITFTCAGAGTVVTTAVTGSWQRIGVVETATGTSGNWRITLATNGDAIDIWRGQMEDISGKAIQVPGEYVSTGVLSSPFHGVDVDAVKYFDTANGNTLASGVITEATGAALTDSNSDPIGYLYDPSSNNYSLRSEEFDNATWTKTNVTVSANSTRSPSGSMNADTLTATAGNATCLQAITLTSRELTYSLWMKRLTGTGNIDLTVDNGSTWTTVAVTSSWNRFEIPAQTLANPTVGIRIVTSGDEIYAWGSQCENLSHASAYMPAVGSQGTRNAQSLTISTTAFTDTDGTSYCEVQCPRQALAGTQNAMQQWVRIRAAGLDATDGANTATVTASVTSVKKASVSWGSGSMRLATQGATAAAGTYDGGWNFVTIFTVGGNATGVPVSAVIRNVRVWNNVKLSATNQDALVGN